MATRKKSDKRPYRKPTLVDYGSIPARTLSTAAMGSIFDVMGVKQAKKF